MDHHAEQFFGFGLKSQSFGDCCHGILLNQNGKQMQKHYFTRLSVAVVLTTGLLLAAAAIPQVGSEAPGFTLPSQDGTPVSLKDLRGKWVVLYFYPKDGTSGCTLEAHNFQRDLAGYEARNALIVGVSVDSTGSHKEFCAKQGLTFKLLADDQKRVAPTYGSLESLLGFKIAARNTFLIDPAGRIAKVWTGVSPSRHSSEVLAALNSLNAQHK
jgi:peroxiredoxin Q/BCP